MRAQGERRPLGGSDGGNTPKAPSSHSSRGAGDEPLEPPEWGGQILGVSEKQSTEPLHAPQLNSPGSLLTQGLCKS